MKESPFSEDAEKCHLLKKKLLNKFAEDTEYIEKLHEALAAIMEGGDIRSNLGRINGFYK